MTYVGSAKPEECVDFGATLNVGDGFVQFLKPLDVDTTAQFEVDVQWTTESKLTAAVTLPAVEIDYEVGTSNKTTLELCPSFVTQDPVTGYFGIAKTDLSSLTDLDQEPELNGDQFACIATRSADVTREEVVTTDKIFLIGDARISRL